LVECLLGGHVVGSVFWKSLVQGELSKTKRTGACCAALSLFFGGAVHQGVFEVLGGKENRLFIWFQNSFI